MKSVFDLSEEEMRSYGYKIVDYIVDHHLNIEDKKPIVSASRE